MPADAFAAVSADAPAASRPSPTNWLAVVAVSASVFSVVTTEMLPVGLLTSIGASLDASAGTAGLAMTAPGVVAAVAAPVLTVATARLDRRLVLAALVGLLTAANLLSALATALPVLLSARVLVGVAIGGVWSIAAGLAVRLVPAGSVGPATSVIFSGVAVASVLGVPAGALIGELAGWRAAFAAMGALSLAVLVALVVLLPPLPPTRAVSLGEVPHLLRDARVRAGLAVTALVVTGHFAAYAYLRPVMEQVSGVGAGLVSTLLLVYGVAGIAGNFAAGAGAPRALRRTILAVTGLLTLSVLLIPVAGEAPATVTVLLAVWGAAYGGVSISMQTWLARAASRVPEAGSALFVAMFNIAISLGALLGGRVADAVTVSGVMWLGGGLVACAAVTAFISRSVPEREALP
ncbi:MFS transporter [Streptosporangium carneum]|uniref:MFS transporter n=1 Tax=Streptosporangium carneum TaxID=47481 RepID=A0A9W6MBD4_9ACTN|nr:MFS transporter [Streptosporangium carneum]